MVLVWLLADVAEHLVVSRGRGDRRLLVLHARVQFRRLHRRGRKEEHAMIGLFLIGRVQDGLVSLLVGHIVQDGLVLLVVAAVVEALLQLLLLMLRSRCRIDNLG